MTHTPFTTDGCSGGMSRAWQFLFKSEPPWVNCCHEHDKAYHQGGTRDDRRRADIALLVCVATNGTGHPVWAIIMWGAVRAFGHPLFKFPWRWGYGWRHAGYKTYRKAASERPFSLGGS